MSHARPSVVRARKNGDRRARARMSVNYGQRWSGGRADGDVRRHLPWEQSDSRAEGSARRGKFTRPCSVANVLATYRPADTPFGLFISFVFIFVYLIIFFIVLIIFNVSTKRFHVFDNN